MNANPMMEQVGRLIGGLLAGGGEVFLPGVGSLYAERFPARRINRREIIPPRQIVSFTPQQRGASLVDEIARVLEANGAESESLSEMAQAVYDRWIARAFVDGTLTIEGVGVLKDNRFTPDGPFGQRLNPQGMKAIRMTRPRRFDWVCWLGVAAVASAVAVGIYAWRHFQEELPGSVPKSRLVAAQPAAQPADSLAASARRDSTASAPSATSASASSAATSATSATSETHAAAATAPAAPAASAAPSAAASRASAAAPAAPATARSSATREASGVASLISGHHYVVMGVFSILDNAKRAAATATAQPEAFTCGVYRFGSKYMVSPFDSTDEAASRLFVRAHADRYPDLWVYTAR